MCFTGTFYSQNPKIHSKIFDLKEKVKKEEFDRIQSRFCFLKSLLRQTKKPKIHQTKDIKC